MCVGRQVGGQWVPAKLSTLSDPVERLPVEEGGSIYTTTWRIRLSLAPRRRTLHADCLSCKMQVLADSDSTSAAAAAADTSRPRSFLVCYARDRAECPQCEKDILPSRKSKSKSKSKRKIEDPENNYKEGSRPMANSPIAHPLPVIFHSSPSAVELRHVQIRALWCRPRHRSRYQECKDLGQ